MWQVVETLQSRATIGEKYNEMTTIVEEDSLEVGANIQDFEVNIKSRNYFNKDTDFFEKRSTQKKSQDTEKFGSYSKKIPIQPQNLLTCDKPTVPSLETSHS